MKMLLPILLFIATPCFADTTPTAAQQQEMQEAFARQRAVRPEHRQLNYFVGDWKAKTTIWMGPQQPPMVSEGKSHSELLFEGRYVETKYEGEFFGQPLSGRGLMGYDNLGERYVATWIDSGSTAVWMGYGSYDAAAKRFTFRGTRDDPMHAGTKVPVHEEMHIVDEGHYVFTWFEQRGGEEVKTMQVDYSRL